MAVATIEKIILTPKANRLKASYIIKGILKPFQMPKKNTVYVIETLDNGQYFSVWVPKEPFLSPMPSKYGGTENVIESKPSRWSYDGQYSIFLTPSICDSSPKEWPGGKDECPEDGVASMETEKLAGLLLIEKGLQVKKIKIAPDSFANGWGAVGYKNIPPEYSPRNLHWTHCCFNGRADLLVKRI